MYLWTYEQKVPLSEQSACAMWHLTQWPILTLLCLSLLSSMCLLFSEKDFTKGSEFLHPNLYLPKKMKITTTKIGWDPPQKIDLYCSKMFGTKKCCGVKTILGNKKKWGLRIFGNNFFGGCWNGIRGLMSSVKWQNPPYTEYVPKPYRVTSVKWENSYFSAI